VTSDGDTAGLRVVVAPDKFKGSLTATEVAGIVAQTVRRHAPGATVIECPIADGGDGTVDVALRSGFTAVDAQVVGPLGGVTTTARYARSGRTAVIELAAAAGLGLIERPDDLTAASTSTYGVGLLVTHALDRGADRIVLGLGGSATTDGGAGMVTALGGRLLDSRGGPLARGGGALAELAVLDLADLDPRLQTVDLVLACDVDNPLQGPDGAAAVYGPQKGAQSPATVAALERGLRRWADVVAAVTGRDLRGLAGCGAAGGTAFGGVAVLGGRITSGFEMCLELSGLGEHLEDAELVIVGEGSLDSQSLRGKGPATLAAVAARRARRVVALSGRCVLSDGQLRATGIDAAYALTDVEPDPRVCMSEASRLLETVAARLAQDWLRSRSDCAADEFVTPGRSAGRSH